MLVIETTKWKPIKKENKDKTRNLS